MLHIAYARVLRNLGVDVALPPKPTKKTLDLGTKYSPEFACFPFKLTLGNMIEALESGADAIFMPGGIGPCRFGYYDAIQEQILKGLGYRFTMGSAENPDRLSDMLDLMKQIAGLRTRGALLKLFYLILMRLSVLDWAIKRYFSIKPREAIPNETDRVFRESVQLIDSSLSFPSLLGARLRASGWFRKIALQPGITPLRIGIIGELFMVLEPSANMGIDMQLTRRGIEVWKSVWLSDWLNDRFRFKPFTRNQLKLSARYAYPYLRYPAGGESMESVGKTVLFTKRGVDGIIHVFPFTCMPELVAQTVLAKVQKDLDIPILTLIFDEHTAQGGIETRIEAFVDLLERRRHSRAIASPIFTHHERG
jgi:predicted nucleotide-binding protein (sugar kinase/HSP70/actin superfamily)